MISNFQQLYFMAVDKITPKITPSEVGIPDPVRNADSAVAGLLNTVYFIAGIAAVLVIILAGYFYVTAAGNASQIKRAKDAIIGAVAGLVVVIMAFVITQFVLGRIG